MLKIRILNRKLSTSIELRVDVNGKQNLSVRNSMTALNRVIIIMC